MALMGATEKTLLEVRDGLRAFVQGVKTSINQINQKFTEKISTDCMVKMTAEYISAENGVITTSAHGVGFAETVYFECLPDTKYYICETASVSDKRVLRVGYTNNIPTVGTSISGYGRFDGENEAIFITGENAKYVCINYFIKGTDDSITPNDAFFNLTVSKENTVGVDKYARKIISDLRDNILALDTAVVHIDKAQALTDVQKQQARDNIGIRKVTQAEYDSLSDTSGIYIIVEE